MGKMIVFTLRSAVTLMMFALVPVCGAADFTAGDGLAQAQKAAAAWHGDAALTRVGTTSLKTDGKALVWQYDYVSPKNVTCARIVMIGGGEPRLQDMGKCTPAKPVSDKFVDSPEMLKAAVQAGFKPAETSNAYLTIVHDSAARNRACWVAYTSADFDPEATAMRGWCVDPQTGKFVVRLSGKTDYR